MRRPLARWVVGVLASGALGCSASAPPRPPGLPPTPATVTVTNPGGDAADPEQAALDRLAHEPWTSGRDRTSTLIIPLADARHWRRVKLWGYPTRTAFRFGDEHYGVMAIWYKPAAENSDPESCLTKFVADARPLVESYGVRVVASHVTQAEHVEPRGRRGPTQTPKGPMVVQIIDADVDAVFTTKRYAGALAAYPSWPGTCLIAGFVVAATKHQDLAAGIRDRWVAEGAPRLTWHPRLLEAPPFDDR